jgi:hypothetical protein
MVKPALGGLIPALALLTLSCPPETESPSNYYPDLRPEIFFAYDNSEPHGAGNNRNYYTVKAVQIGAGTYCNIWVDQTVLVSGEDARRIINAYDNAIHPRITGVFGAYDSLFKSDDGKVEILLLDIKDGYEKGGGQSFVAGYFDSRDILTLFPAFKDDYPYGNGARILYIDTNPNTPASELTYSTIAHELQHLINFLNSLEYRVSGGYLYLQDIWIDEGLSSAAEYIYRGSHDSGRIDHFNRDPLGTIAKGNNFFVWGRPEGNETVLDDYATVYMFFQWLRLQSGGGTGIYTAIAQSGDWDYRAVTGAAAANFGGNDSSDFSNWQTLLGTWHRANYVNSSNGRDGYRGDSALKPRVWAVPKGEYRLYPGGAVYSIYDGAAPASAPEGIQFAAITRTETAFNNQYPYTDTKRLLMFNKLADVYNSDGSFNNGFIKNGSLQGSGEDKPRSLTGRNITGGGPYAIDVRDLRGRRGRERPINVQGLNLEK